MKQKMKTLFAVMVIALMLAVPMVSAVGNDNASDAAAVISAGSVPSGSDYGYVIKTTTATNIQVGAVVHSDGTTATEVYSTQYSTQTTIPEAMSDGVFSFSTTTGLGPFNSFYAAINASTDSSKYVTDESKEYRINTQIGGIAYVLNPSNLTKTLAGTTYTPQLYNIMLVIPTIYWAVYTDTSGGCSYLCMSSSKSFDFSAISTTNVVLTSYTTFSTDAAAYAHTFTSSTTNDTVMPYIALGVYEAYRTGSADSTSYGVNSGQLVSQPDRAPTSSTTEANFRAAAKVGNTDNDNGTYMLWNYYQWTLYKMMSYTVTGSMNSQWVMGNGIVSSSKTDTGGTSAAYQLSDTTNTTAVSLFLENGWGNVWEFVDDTAVANGTGYLYLNNRLSVSSGNLSLSELNNTSSKWVTSGTSNYNVATTATTAKIWNQPLTVGSTYNTNTGATTEDGVWYSTSYSTATTPFCLFVGGSYGFVLRAGVAAAYAASSVSASDANIGARLAYAMTADAAVATTTADTYQVNIDDGEYVTIKDASGNIINDGDPVVQDSKITITLNSRIPEGEKLIITTYAMLGKPMYFDSSSAIGDVKSFKLTADLFVYLDNGMMKSVAYQPDIYDGDGDRQDGKEAVTVQLSQSVNSQVWAKYRIANSSNSVIASDSFYFTGDSLTIQMDKQTSSNSGTVGTASLSGTTVSWEETSSGKWVKSTVAISKSGTFYVNKGATIYYPTSLGSETTPYSAFVVSSTTSPSDIAANVTMTISEVETNDNVYMIKIDNADTSKAATLYFPATYYHDWSQGTYYFSLQTENGYINVVNFPFKVGAYKITIADGSRDYVSMITVNGVERYTLQANEIAQITMDSAAVAELGDYHVFITYNDTMVELTSTSSGVYRFSMPAYNVVVSVSLSADGYAIGITYTYGSDPGDIGYRAIIYSGAGTAVPSGTISGEVYGVVSGKLYDGTKFSAVVHETLLSGEYTKDSRDWIKTYVQTTETTYYVAAGETIYYLNNSGGISSFVVNTNVAPADVVAGTTMTITAVGDTTTPQFYSIALSVSSADTKEVFYIPLTSTITSVYDSTYDEIGTATLSGTTVTFTAEEDGNWIKVAAAASDTQAYYVANGAEIFYPSAEGNKYSSFVVNKIDAPTVTGGTLRITPLGDSTVPQAYKLVAAGDSTEITLYVPLTSVITSAYADKDVIGEYDADGFDYARSEILTFTEGEYIKGLNQVTAVIPSFTPAGGATVVGNQYFASAYTASANVAAMKVDRSNGDVLFLLDNVDRTKSYSYTIDLYYNYDVRTGQSTRTVMDKVTVSGTITGPVDSVVIDYESLGIEKSKVVVYSAKVGSNDTLRVAI